MSDNQHHIPVMLQEAIEGLNVQTDHWYIDATFGQGGHTQAILDQGGKVVGFDYDQQNIVAGTEKFSTPIQDERLILIRENFSKLKETIDKLQKKNQVDQISGILFDFGTTSQQLTDTSRGLSFSGDDQELDMRLDQRLGVKAKDLLAIMSQTQLQKVFEVFGGETEAKKIAKEINKLRREGRFIRTVSDLTQLISRVKHRRSANIHPATKVFQALRIAVNNELENIEQALPQALKLLEPQGIMITIAFHEGEDRLVKYSFRDWTKAKLGLQKPKKVTKPTMTEISNNPKSRSAKLRRFIKN